MSSVRGKVAVVTGAGSGIGRQLALELAKRGARPALSDVDEPVGVGGRRRHAVTAAGVAARDRCSSGSVTLSARSSFTSEE